MRLVPTPGYYPIKHVLLHANPFTVTIFTLYQLAGTFAPSEQLINE